MFRTELNIDPSTIKIGLTDPILTIGSCFSDNIGERFSENKFDVLSNPFGTVYNPISIFKLIRLGLNNSTVPDSGYLVHEGLHAHYDFHSSFSTLDKSELAVNIQQAIDRTHNKFKKLKFLIITLGTAFVYERVDSNEIVANCHKVPAKAFQKKLLTQEDIIEGFEELYHQLPDELTIIFTVSPVRHIKDTLPLNSVSKSTLRLVCNTLSNQYANVHYFPSYEIMVDDLRDYRFYASDMLHPTRDAEEYIWDKFSNAYFDKGTKEFLKEWQNIKSAIKHRPFNPSSDKHQQFVLKTIEKIHSLPHQLDFSEELKSLNSQLLSS